jgi:hypothetical protein
MELLTILAADYANIAQGGKLNVMGIFRNIYATSFPAKHLSMTLVFKLGAEFGEYGQERQITIKLLNADGQELLKLESQAKVPSPSGGQRPEIDGIIQINEIIFPEPGRYQFTVFVDKDWKGSLPIDVMQIEQKSSELRQE